MKSKSQPYDEREESIRIAVNRSKGPLSSEELYAIVHPFFSSKRQFSSMMGGMTKGKRITSVKNGKNRFYSPSDNHEANTSAEKSQCPASLPVDRPPRIDEIFTKNAAAFHAAMRSRKIKPMMTNDPDKKRGD